MSPLLKMADGGSAADAVAQIYAEQLGRAPDAAGLAYYAEQIASGAKTPQQVAAEIDRSTEGYNYDTQNVVSAYRSNFGRDPDQAGLQYYMGQEDSNLQTSKQIADAIKAGASGSDVQALQNNPQGFLNITSEALRADPYAGGYAVDNPYIFDTDAAKARPNVSQTAAGQYIQFVNPITQRPSYTGYTPDGQFKVFAGNDVLQPDRVRQAVNLATQSGALSQADANRILTAVSSPEQFRQITGNPDPNANTLYALLSEPKAAVVLDSLGVQIGENADRSLAMAESAARQNIVDRARETTGQDINPSTLLQADIAKEMGVKFPFTQQNLTIDPATGLPIRTMMTAEDIQNNLLTYLGIPIDKTLKNVFTSGLGQYVPDGQTPGGGTPTTPPAVVGTTGDFRGLAFPQARPTEVGETPAMLGFEPYTLTQPGSGQQKTTEPQPVIPVNKAEVDPATGALLGAAISSFLPGANTNIGSALDTIAGGIKTLASKNGGLATPLMKEGGMVPHYANGGFSQIASGVGSLLSTTPARGALFGALISQLLNAQAQSQAANAYRGIDMSKVGVIPPRTTMVGPARFAPYRQYASRPEIPASVSSPINVGALRASQVSRGQNPFERYAPSQGASQIGVSSDQNVTPDFSKATPAFMGTASPLLGGINPNYQPPAGFDADRMRSSLNRYPPGIIDDDFVPKGPKIDMPVGQRLQGMFKAFGQPMADGGAAYYTYGQHVDPMDYLRGMAQGGMAHGGLHGAQHTYDVPTVDGRKDYRQGSAVTGPGDGQSDDIPAMLADGEYVFDADTVAQLGNGSTKAGSQMLDKFREEIRQHKRSAPVNKIPPPSKSPLAYLAAAQKKMKGASRG